MCADLYFAQAREDGWCWHKGDISLCFLACDECTKKMDEYVMSTLQHKGLSQRRFAFANTRLEPLSEAGARSRDSNSLIFHLKSHNILLLSIYLNAM
jgi:hypothetical protein